MAFLDALPADTGMAFVLIQHLDPTHKSSLAELLIPHTRMAVTVVAGDTVPEPDKVYLIPPAKTLVMEGGMLTLRDPVEPRGSRAPVDAFLISLAHDQGDNAACVILSGAGSDGTAGLRAIKECGGLTMAQAEGSAKYDSMPRSATATGLADYVLPVEKMPAALTDYFGSLTTVRDRRNADGVRHDAADHLTRICAILQTRTGHDFNRYKKNTLIRRIQRRMQVRQVAEVPEYIDLLRKDEVEVRHLFRDLLINVTQFFRDPAAFDALAREAIPAIVDGRGPDKQIRLWIPGCSTGEEAYSLAILVAERMREKGVVSRVQIFASDIDEEALDVARVGRYPETIAKDVSPERLARFFTPADGGFAINKDIRDMCVFSMHSVIKDPPFSKIDLISCRNLLIYLGADLQAKLIPIFHYALKPHGFLLLGTSENISQHGRLFKAVDSGNRLFQRRDVPSPHDLQFPLNTPAAFQPDARAPARRATEVEREAQDRLVERLILDNYAPAFAVVTENGDIVHVSTRTGKYLELPAGAPNLNVVDMARLGLRNDIRVALRRAVRDRRRVVQSGVEFAANGGRQAIDLIVHPVPNGNQFMIIFHDIGTLRAETGRDAEARLTVAEGDEARLQELEAELQLTRERLRTTIEELETSNEELKSSNEEMVSMNEELQSTNEELESSKEELQSINEELETVNVELRHKLQELSHANSDLQNLFDSTDIATIFLGNDLNIKNFTPAARKIFNLIESDKGRPLIDLASRFPLDGLKDQAAKVIRTLVPVEREIGGGESPDLLMRVVPYRTVENVIEGVVLTFVDVSRLKRAERRLAGSEARYRALMQGAHEAAMVFTLDDGRPGVMQEGNEAARKLLGYDEDEMLGKRPGDILAADADLSGLVAELEGKGKVTAERAYRAKDGTLIPVEERSSLVGVGEQRLIIVQAQDIRERRENENRRELLMRELQHRVKNTMATVTAIVAHTGQRTQDFATFKSQLDGRLRALADAHGRLTQTNWGPVPLRDIAEDALRAYAADARRVSVTGDDVLVSPRAALTLTIALHELATNAAKHGALAVDAGRVRLGWRPSGQDLEIAWEEQGGPRVPARPGRGFGRYLLEKGIAHDLDGRVELRFDPDGLRCFIHIPPEHLASPGNNKGH